MEDGEVSANDSSRINRKWKVAVIFFIGFMDLLGVSMIIPLLPIFIFNLSASRSLSGAIGSIYGGLQIFSSPTVGKLSDAYGRKNVMLLSYIVPSIGYLFLGFSTSVWMVVLARIPCGLLKHGLSICKAYLADISKPEDRPAVLGYFNAVSNIGFIVGPIIGGYLSDADPTLKLTIRAGSVIFSLNFLVVLILLPTSTARSETKTKATTTSSRMNRRKDVCTRLNQFFKSLNVFHWRQLADVISIQFLTTFSMLMFRSNFPIFLEGNFAISKATLGKVLSFSSVATTMASATCGVIFNHYSSHSKHLLHFMILLFLSLLSIGLCSSVSWILIPLIALSLSTANLRICMLSFLFLRGREDEKGSIVGVVNSMSSIGRMLAPALVGVAQEVGSRFTVFLSVALSFLALAGTVVITMRDVSGKEPERESDKNYT